VRNEERNDELKRWEVVYEGQEGGVWIGVYRTGEQHESRIYCAGDKPRIFRIRLSTNMRYGINATQPNRVRIIKEKPGFLRRSLSPQGVAAESAPCQARVRGWQVQWDASRGQARPR
jgi:hypothetical protein